MNYKKINIKNIKNIQSELLNYLKVHTDILNDKTIGFIPLNKQSVIDHCADTLDFFLKLNLTPVRFNLYKTIKNGDSLVHIDTYEYKTRINIPILNCEHSQTKFFIARPSVKIVQKNKLPFILCDQESAIEVDNFALDMPTVFKVMTPHQVIMDENFSPRISLTVKCEPDPIFLLRD